MSNYRVKTSAQFPEVVGLESAQPEGAIKRIGNFLKTLKLALDMRDREFSAKINQLHIEHTTTAPSDASPPSDPYPVLRIYNDSGVLYLYAYTSAGWKRIKLLDLTVAQVVSYTEISSFSNSWVNYESGFSNAGYYKDPFGFVHLQGLIKDGTLGAAAFTLPEGYRPAATKDFIAFAYEAAQEHGFINIATTGVVTIYGSANNYVSLEGITFYAG